MNGTLTISGEALHFAVSGCPEIPADSAALLTIRAGKNLLRIDLSSGGSDDGLVSGQIPLALLEQGDADLWKDALAHLDIAGARHQIRLRVSELDQTATQTGHVAGIDADGFLNGWSLCEALPDADLPVIARVGAVQLGTMTSGGWQNGRERAYRINVAPHLASNGLTRIDVSGANEAAWPFTRKTFFAALLDSEILLAAPLTITEGLISGAFQLPGNPTEPLRVELRDGDTTTISTCCNRFSHPNFNFNGFHCGFFIRLPSRFNPETTRLVLKHPDIEQPIEFGLRELLSDATARIQ